MVTKVVQKLRGPSGVDMSITDEDGVYTQNVGNPGSTLITTKTVTAAENGTTFFLSLAGGFTTTLPAPAAGLRYKFIVKTAPTTAYIIVTDSSANIMIGGINELEVDSTEDGPYIANGDQLNFVASTAVVGDFVEFESDGTSWYINGQTQADGGITLAST